MVKIKAFIIGADWIVFTASGYSAVDIASTLVGGNLALSSIENFIKLLLSMAGFVYLCARTYHFIIKSSLDRDFRREEIIEKQNENHKHNTFSQFKEQLKDINHENLK